MTDIIIPDYRMFSGGIILTHSAKGTTWKDHLYVKKVGSKYYYPEDLRKEKTAQAKITIKNATKAKLEELKRKKALENIKSFSTNKKTYGQNRSLKTSSKKETSDESSKIEEIDANENKKELKKTPITSKKEYTAETTVKRYEAAAKFQKSDLDYIKVYLDKPISTVSNEDVFTRTVIKKFNRYSSMPLSEAADRLKKK